MILGFWAMKIHLFTDDKQVAQTNNIYDGTFGNGL
jgi:hypothetical protein